MTAAGYQVQAGDAPNTMYTSSDGWWSLVPAGTLDGFPFSSDFRGDVIVAIRGTV